MKKTLIVAGIAIGGLAFAALPAQAAGYQSVTFGTDSVTWTTPDECGANNPGCSWELLINEPNVGPAPVTFVTSPTPGTLTLKYPAYCGLIQADGLVSKQGGGWRRLTEAGTRTTINTCTPTTTTTSPTTAVPPTTTTVPKAPVVEPTRTLPTVTTTTVPTPAPEAPVVAPTPTVPNQLPDIPPASNGVTQGNG
jgi:hypothetical protein